MGGMLSKQRIEQQLELVAQGRFDADSTARERIMALALSKALERLR